MRHVLIAATCMAFAAPAFAAPLQTPGSIVVAQVAAGATGGVSGGPNQQQAVVPSGATGGKSGGPNQQQAVIPSGATGGKSGGPNQQQAKQTKKAKTKN